MSRPFQVIGSDLPDEFRDVDARGTAFGAGGIIAEQTTIGIDEGRIAGLKRGMEFAEVASVLILCQPVIFYRHSVCLLH